VTDKSLERSEPILASVKPDMQPADTAPDDARERVDDSIETPLEDGLIATPAQFSRVREDKGWSLGEVAGRLRMQQRQIEAIEAGRWEDLPGTAFVRAAIRSYARLLDRDAAPLLASVAQLDTGLDLRSTHRPPVAISPTGSIGEASGIGRWGLALLGLLAVIAIAFYFAPATDLRWPSQWFDGEGDTMESASTIATSPAPVDAGPAPARSLPAPTASPSDDAVAAAARAANELLAGEPGADLATPDTTAATAPGDASPDSPAQPRPGDSQAEASPAAVSSAMAGGAESGMAGEAGATAAPEAEAPGSAPAAVAGATESAPPALDAGSTDSGAAPGAMATASMDTTDTTAPALAASSLVMNFDGECWVEVTDAAGKRLVYGLQKPQTSLSLDVPGPVSVLIGNADAVTLTRGGESVDVTSAARDGVARLRLE